MTNKHPALRLAEMTDVTDRSVIWQKWKQDACEQLRTQYALLERAREVISVQRAALCQLSPCMHPMCKQDCIEWQDGAEKDAEEYLAALNQHLDQK